MILVKLNPLLGIFCPKTRPYGRHIPVSAYSRPPGVNSWLTTSATPKKSCFEKKMAVVCVHVLFLSQVSGKIQILEKIPMHYNLLYTPPQFMEFKNFSIPLGRITPFCQCKMQGNHNRTLTLTIYMNYRTQVSCFTTVLNGKRGNVFTQRPGFQS